MKKIEAAAQTCRRQNNYKLSGQIYEDSGDIGSAAKDYCEGKLHEDALRCYTQIGDEPWMARVYERMKEFDKALAIWKKLGKAREVSRVSKKKEKTMAKKQLKLF